MWALCVSCSLECNHVSFGSVWEDLCSSVLMRNRKDSSYHSIDNVIVIVRVMVTGIIIIIVILACLID